MYLADQWIDGDSKIHCSMKVISIIISLILIQSFKVAAQDSSRIAVNIFYAPEIGFRTLESKDSFFSSQVLPFREAVEKPGLGHSVGGSIIYKLSSLLKIRSGITLNERVYRVPETPIKWEGPGSDAVIRLVRYPTTVSYKERTRIGYISIPLTLEVERSLKRSSVGIFAGGSFDFFLYHKINVTEYNSHGDGQSFGKNLNYLNTFEKVAFNFLAGISLDYDLNENLILSFEPYAKRSGPVIQNPRLTAKLQSYGVNLSLGLKL